MTHAELIENAFVNYLSGMQWPTTLTGIFPGENNLDKAGQRIVCYLENGDVGDEEPPLSGNRISVVQIQIRTPFSKLTAQESAQIFPEPLLQHQAICTLLQTAILNCYAETLSAAVNGFYVHGIINRTLIQTQEENAWADEWKIRMMSCPSSFPN